MNKRIFKIIYYFLVFIILVNFESDSSKFMKLIYVILYVSSLFFIEEEVREIFKNKKDD